MARDPSMAHAKTVFIVGAGASHEADLPVGRDSADAIAKMFRYSLGDFGDVASGDRDFLGQINRQYPREVNSLVKIAQMISHGAILAPSIDQFIDKHAHDPQIALLGKAAIVATILDAEKRSYLGVAEHERKRMDFLRLRGTWYWGLGQLITVRIGKSSLERAFDDVAIVCFNYDHCIEQFLAHYLSDLYDAPLRECRDLVNKKLEILRPYGQVAPIYDSNNMMGFGADWRHRNVFHLADNIRTFTEAVDGDVVARIRDAIRYADTIAFLGFHYLEQNMELLTPPQSSRAGKIFGTAYRRSEYEIIEIKGFVRNMIMGSDGNKRVRASVGDPIIVPMECHKLFADYGLGLQLPPLTAHRVLRGESNGH